LAGNRVNLPRGISVRHANGRTTYRVRVTFQGAQYQVGEYETLGDARAARDIAKAQVVRGTFVPIPERHRQWREAREAKKAAATSVREWSTQWLEDLEKAGRSPGTLKAYRSTLDVHILPVIGDKRLGDVTPANIEALTAGKTDALKYNITRTASSMFRAAVAAKKIATSPVETSFKKTRRDGEAAILTWDEVARIAPAMPESIRVAVWIGAVMGLRLGEVLGLQRRDLDLDAADGPVLHVRRQWQSKASPPAYAPPKAGSARVLAIPDSLVPVLRDHLKRFTAEAPEAPLLPSPLDKKVPVSQTGFDRFWRAAREPVRSGYRFHDLRHVALTEYRRQGATDEELLRRGGHSDMDTARIYQGVTLARDRSLTEKLNNGLKGIL